MNEDQLFQQYRASVKRKRIARPYAAALFCLLTALGAAWISFYLFHIARAPYWIFAIGLAEGIAFVASLLLLPFPTFVRGSSKRRLLFCMGMSTVSYGQLSLLAWWSRSSSWPELGAGFLSAIFCGAMIAVPFVYQKLKREFGPPID